MTAPEAPTPSPRVGRTPGTVLAVAALIGAGIAWVGISSLENFGQPLPRIPLVAGLAIGVAAGVVGRIAWLTRQRIQLKRERVAPSRAVALLALGKTVLIAGAGLAAAYLTVAGLALPDLEAALPRERVLNSGLASLASALLGLAGWFLEGACIVPTAPPDDSSDASEDAPPE